MKLSLFLTLSLFTQITYADPALEDTRYVTQVIRNSDGSIHRRADVLRQFQVLHHCPSTGLSTGACAGWQMNHVIPLACGGKDAVSNLQWLRVALKTCATICVDRYERKINAANPPIPDTANCVNTLVP